MTDRTAAPRVSVVLPCYNAARHLLACLDSLSRQVFTDFEVIALDDGSDDDTGAILSHHAAKDARVRVFHNERNLGLVATLNRGLGLARGEIVARMDADDEALPGRLELQTKFLESHPDVDVVSSTVALMDDAGKDLGLREPWATHPLGCRFVAGFATPVIHPAVMARRHCLLEFSYSTEPQAVHTEDYELWSRLARAGRGIANMTEPLLRFRISQESVSRRHEAIQVQNFVTCVGAHLAAELGEDIPREQVEVLANRIDLRRAHVPLSAGLGFLRRLTTRALAGAAGVPEAQREIAEAGEMQLLDILLQCALKGRVGLRLQALPRFLVAAALAGRRPRRYLLSKLPARA